MTKTFKARASGAGAIMTDPRSKSETLSETCKTAIREQWIYDTYGREQLEFATPAIRKGLLNEEQGLSMLSLHWGEFLEKNETRKSDDYMMGTCDTMTDDRIADIKCSHNIFTFAKADLKKEYDWQLQVYMRLWKKKHASLVYVLTDTPDVILHAETKSAIYKIQDDTLYQEVFDHLKKQVTYSDIPAKDRIKIFDVEYDPQRIEQLIERVKLCQEFYNNLSL